MCAVYVRPNSPYFWIRLEGSGERFATKILKKGATGAQTKENRQLAQAAYTALMGDAARKVFKLPITKAVRTFHQQAEWYAEHHTLHHGGALQEAWKIARLRRFFGTRALGDITPTRWQAYTRERTTTDGVSLSTVGRELAVMKAILNTAVGEQLEVSPLATVKRKTTKLRAKRTIAAKDEPAFLKALKAIDEELHDLYLVGVGTLLRRETLLYLRRGAHRGDRLVVDTKTGPLQVPLTGPTPLQRRAARVLRRRMPASPDGYFFPRWKGTFAAYEDPGHPGGLFLKKIRRAAKAAGLPWGLKADGIVWHTATRATGATRMMRQYQVDIRTVQMIGGWSSLDQMAEYLGLDLELFGRRATA